MRDNVINAARRNLSEVDRRQRILSEERELLANSLADSLCEELEDLGVDELYERFLSAFPMPTIGDKVIFFSSLCEYAKKKEETESLAFEADQPVTPGSHGKIAFVRNIHNDIALESFSSYVAFPKQVQKQSFEDCCEAVSSGECEFALIPIENSSDGKMFGFYSLIDRYSLHICATCTVDSEDLSKVVIYALVGRNLVHESIEKLCGRLPRAFEFSVLGAEGEGVGDIPALLEKCSVRLIGTSSVALPYDSRAMRYYFTCSLQKTTDIDTLALALKVEYPQYTPIGIYREIDR